MQVIPSIDLRGGKTVRLLQGDYADETVYEADPVETAIAFEGAGAEVIHVVDLDGARSGVPENLDVLAAIFRNTRACVEVGGGIRTVETALRLIEAGAGRVVFGTALLRDPQLGPRAFAELGEKTVAGIDARDGKVAVSGWTEQSEVDALEFALRLQDDGCRRAILTDISRDGALSGPNLAMMAAFARSLEIPLVASGGVSSLEDLIALSGTGVEGAIVGRAIYEGKLDLREAVFLGKRT